MRDIPVKDWNDSWPMERHLLSIDVLPVSVFDSSNQLDWVSRLLSGTSSLISITHTTHSSCYKSQIQPLTWCVVKCSGTHWRQIQFCQARWAAWLSRAGPSTPAWHRLYLQPISTQFTNGLQMFMDKKGIKRVFITPSVTVQCMFLSETIMTVQS